MKNPFKNLINSKDDPINFFLTDKGLDLETRDGRRMVAFDWDDVTQIETYKVDCAVYDEIVLKFHTAKGPFAILEGHAAFIELTYKLADFFNVPEEWYNDVMHPAFETNHKVLFKK